MVGRHLPPRHDAGDESTLGGYMAVHGRPAAFDGPGGLPYSVDIGTDDADGDRGAVGAYLLFLRWRRVGEPGVDAHLESAFLAYADTHEAAREAIGRMPLPEVKAHLDQLVGSRGGGVERRWWDAMRDDDVHE